jgi:5-(carboxyamino)imidazole ribonucleotide synthase
MVSVQARARGDLHRALLHVMARDPGVKGAPVRKADRPGRKIGHVTVCGEDLAGCRERARHAADFIAGTISESEDE